MFNIFIDTEFTHLGKDPDLLSIGMIAETGETLYAEVSNFATEKFNKNKKFLKEYVIPNLKYIKYSPSLNTVYTTEAIKQEPEITEHMDLICNSVTVKKAVNNWIGLLIEKHGFENGLYKEGFMIQFVSDCAAYDAVLINDVVSELLTTSNEYTSLPLISPIVYDIVYDIRSYLEKKNGTASLYDAFDINREDLVKELGSELPENIKKHNSFFDAQIIKSIYDKLH